MQAIQANEMPEILWRAYYEDGTELWQRMPDGKKYTYQDIDREQLTAFGLYQGDRLVVLIDFQNDTNGDPQIGRKRLIWRIRHQLSTDGTDVKIHLAGWQRKVNGRNVQAICYVNSFGEVIMGGQWMNRAPMNAIKILEHESDLNE